MIGMLDLLLRLSIWFLLTADLSPANMMIGIGVAFLFPRRFATPSFFQDWLRAIGEVLVAIPQAYIETFQIMFFPHNHEAITMERVKPNRTPGLIFLDIFIITFTPKTIALRYHEHGWYEVHRIQRRKKA